MAAADEDTKMAPTMDPFQLGVLTSRVQGVIERVDRFEASVGTQISGVSAKVDNVAQALQTLADGYVRREQFAELKRAVEDQGKSIDTLNQKTAASDPVI